MAFIVPNAGQTGGSATYINVNQAEPDSLDFEILGNRSSWIRSGGGVTSVSSTQVVVAAGVAVIQGVPYSFNGATITIPDCSVVSVARFDAIVVRLASGTATVTRIAGGESDTNPTLPRSRSTLGTQAFTPLFNIDFATDVVLHTVYKSGGTSITAANVVDKRVVDARPVTYASNAVPTNATPGVVGDRRIVNGAPYTYVLPVPAEDESTWRSEADAASDYSPPVGSIVAWAGASTPPDSFLPCDGRTLSKTTYPELWGAIGYKYGGAGDSFSLPNVNDERTIYGVNIDALSFGDADGDNELKLAEEHIPAHNHTLLTNNTDNTHGPHAHDIRATQLGTNLTDAQKLAAIAGGDLVLLARNGDGTPVTRKTEQNDTGLNHTPNMGEYGRSIATQTAVPLKGRHINLSWYMRVK